VADQTGEYGRGRNERELLPHGRDYIAAYRHGDVRYIQLRRGAVQSERPGTIEVADLHVDTGGYHLDGAVRRH
jgi:hypothetical protein